MRSCIGMNGRGIQCRVTPEMIKILVIRVIVVRKFFISFFLFLFFITKFKAGDARSHFIRLMCHYFLAVLAARLKLAAVGAPLAPGFLIFSSEPFLILKRLAWIFA